MSEENLDKLFYTMGEVSSMLEVSPSLLRFWEKEFPELRPRKNKKGNRLYTREDIETIRLIYRLTKEQGYTLAGAREKLSTGRSRAERDMEIADALKRVRQFLVEIKENL